MTVTADKGVTSFAKQLVNNRKGTLKMLKRWLLVQCKREALSYPAMLKLWRALFISIRLCDLPPKRQQSLVQDIANIMKLLPDTKQSILFIRGFCETTTQEWACIDHSHLGKFRMCTKTVIQGVFQFCEFHSWDAELSDVIYRVLDELIINNSECPDSVLVIIAEHLYEIHAASPNTRFLTKLLKSFTSLISISPKKELIQELESKLFKPLLDQCNLVDSQTLLGHIDILVNQSEDLAPNRALLTKLHNELSSSYGIEEIKSPEQLPLIEGEKIKDAEHPIATRDIPEDVEQTENKNILDTSLNESVKSSSPLETHATDVELTDIDVKQESVSLLDNATIEEKDQKNNSLVTPTSCLKTDQKSKTLGNPPNSKSATSEGTSKSSAKTLKTADSGRKRKRKDTPEKVITPLSARPCKKRVRLSMENNQTLVFKKSASLESPTPYDGTKKPARSALKTSPAAVKRSRKSTSRAK